jgi:hypothetical protein
MEIKHLYSSYTAGVNRRLTVKARLSRKREQERDPI